VEILADLCYAYEPPHYPQQCAGTTSSGVAAHTIVSNAQRAALLELYERDALMLVWMNRSQPPRISDEKLPAAARVSLENVRRMGYTCVSLDGTCRSVPVAFAVAYRATAPALILGAGAESSLGEAAVHAWQEAEVELFWRLREARHEVPSAFVAPEYVVTCADHARLYNDPTHASLAAFLWANDRETSRDPSSVIDLLPTEDDRFDLKTFAQAYGLDAIYKVRYGSFLGFPVVRLLVPNLVPIAFGWNQFPVDHPARYGRCSVPAGSRWPGTSIPPHPLS
jgi:ribosomal protein S12 methylthiotransferase accessory factor YcaO